MAESSGTPELATGHLIESIFALLAGLFCVISAALLIYFEKQRTALLKRGFSKYDGRLPRTLRRGVMGVGVLLIGRSTHIFGNSHGAVATSFAFQVALASFEVVFAVKITDVAVQQYIALNRLGTKVDWNHSYGRYAVILSAGLTIVMSLAFTPVIIAENRMRYRAMWLYSYAVFFGLWTPVTVSVVRRIKAMVTQSQRTVSRMSMAARSSLTNSTGSSSKAQAHFDEEQKKKANPLQRFTWAVYFLGFVMFIFMFISIVVATLTWLDDDKRLYPTKEDNEYETEYFLFLESFVVFACLWYAWAPLNSREAQLERQSSQSRLQGASSRSRKGTSTLQVSSRTPSRVYSNKPTSARNSTTRSPDDTISEDDVGMMHSSSQDSADQV